MPPDSTKGVSTLLKGINFNKILGGANKTLGFVKQAIPVYKQVRPMFGNARTFLNMYGAVKSDKTPEVDIKDTRPLPHKQNNKFDERKTNNNDLNDTLTFFQ
jgi:hypothetical protein